MEEAKKRGLIIVYTGPGKGKTTAAMGLAMRGAGHHLKTLVIQFIKGSWHYGELEAVKKLVPYVEIMPMGKGFIRTDQDRPDVKDMEAAAAAWDLSKKKMDSGEFDIIILDEINYALAYKLIDLKDVLDTLHARPDGLHLVLTGRDAHPRIIEIADLVTEMNEIKHPFQKGIKALKGIEF
jgi:cob(I)alamin adenosyltransferase